MDTSLRDMLDQIDLWLQGSHGGSLWDVLSALRGPDNGNEELKSDTTAVIRAVAFPGLAVRQAQGIGSFCGATNTDKTVITCWELKEYGKPLDSPTHFLNHVHDAANALKILRW